MPGGFHFANLVCMSLNAKCPLRVKSGHDPLKSRCLLYPRKQTFSRALGMSATGHKQTSVLSVGLEKTAGVALPPQIKHQV